MTDPAPSYPIPVPVALGVLGHTPDTSDTPQSDARVEALGAWLALCGIRLVSMPWTAAGVPGRPFGKDRTACAVVSPLDQSVAADGTISPIGGWVYDGYYWLWTDVPDAAEFRSYVANLVADPELPPFPGRKALVSADLEPVGAGISVGVISAL